MEYQDINAKTIDRWVEDGWEWGKPVSHEVYEKALKGEWDIVLTPCKTMPHTWLGDIRGKKLLGLACGGGQQMPVFAALGAECTVLDYSEKQLESERMVAAREGYGIRILRADMTKPLPFENGSFDIVVNPISTCYVRKVKPIYREAARVLRPGGILVCAFDSVLNYIVDENEERVVFPLPFDPVADEKARKFLEDVDCGMQFSHTMEEHLSGLLEAGFTVTDFYGDTGNEGRLAEMNIETFYAARCIKK